MAVLLTVVGILGLALFAHEVNASIALADSNAKAFAERAAQRHQPFFEAAFEFENRDTHEGIHSYATLRPARNGRRPPAASAVPSPSAGATPAPPPRYGPPPNETAIIDGVVRSGAGMRARFEGSRFGYAIATLFGVRVLPPQPFLNGVISFGPDPAVFQNAALIIIGSVVLAAIAVGLLAYFIGRYITQQAIQPLVDVTEALQRFAARDFRPQAITLARKSDFDVLAHAYNAAAEQVSTAFAEREAAEAQMRQFVADAGHELRTPLTIVLGYIDLLRRRVSEADERSKFIFSSIASEGRRMRTLVDNLVLLAKLEGEDMRLFEPFDVANWWRRSSTCGAGSRRRALRDRYRHRSDGDRRSRRSLRSAGEHRRQRDQVRARLADPRHELRLRTTGSSRSPSPTRARASRPKTARRSSSDSSAAPAAAKWKAAASDSRSRSARSNAPAARCASTRP